MRTRNCRTLVHELRLTGSVGIVNVNTKACMMHDRIVKQPSCRDILHGDDIVTENASGLTHAERGRRALDADIGKAGNVVFQEIHDLCGLTAQRNFRTEQIGGIERIDVIFLRSIDHAFIGICRFVKAHNVDVLRKLARSTSLVAEIEIFPSVAKVGVMLLVFTQQRLMFVNALDNEHERHRLTKLIAVASHVIRTSGKIGNISVARCIDKDICCKTNRAALAVGCRGTNPISVTLDRDDRFL